MEIGVFSCSICGDESLEICTHCTKDACGNHLCERCRRCSDCCLCDMPITRSAKPKLSVPPAINTRAAEDSRTTLELIHPPASDGLAEDLIESPITEGPFLVR